MSKKLIIFWEKNENWIFLVILADYFLLSCWEHSVYNAVSTIFDQFWLLFLMAGLLLTRSFRRKKAQSLGNFFQDSKILFPLFLVVVLFLIFLDWLRVGWGASFLFSFLSLLILIFVSRAFSQKARE